LKWITFWGLDNMDIFAMGYFKIRIFGICGSKKDSLLAAHKFFYCKLAFQGGNHNAVMLGGNGAVNHKKVAVHNSGIDHGFSMRPHKKCRRLVSDQMFVEIEPLFNKIVSGRGKTGFSRTQIQWKLKR